MTDPEHRAQSSRGTPERAPAHANNFNGTVVAPYSTFAASGDGEPRRKARTGKLTAHEIGALCECFAEPPSLAEAGTALKTGHVIVLTGASGTGKRTSAVKLLHERAGLALEVLSPTLTLEELAGHDFKAGHGYLVEDWQPSPRTDDETDYPWLILSQQVELRQAYLVITAASGKAGRSVTAFPWKQPRAAAVLTAYTRNTAATGKVDQLVKRLPRTYEMQLLATIGRNLAAGRKTANPVRLPGGQVRLRRSSSVRIALMVLPVLLVAAGIPAARLIWPDPGHTEATLESAQAVVTAVKSPDRLATQLLDTPFRAADMPAGARASANQLSTERSGAGVPGLDEDISTSFSNAAIYTQAATSYLVFENQPDAAAYLHHLPALPAGYQAASGKFTASGIADPVRCLSAREAGQQQVWSCSVRSGNVISYSTVTGGGSGGAALDAELVRDAVTHLRKTAASVSSPSALPPQPTPASPAASKLPGSRFPAALVPEGLTWSTPYFQLTTSPQPSGVIGQETLNQFKVQVAGETDWSRIYYYIFDDDQDAHAFFATNAPPMTNGHPDEMTRSKSILPATTSSQRAECQSYREPATGAAGAMAKSSCDLQWGDIVISAVLQVNATLADPDPVNPDIDVPYTLARASALYIGQLNAS